MSRADGMACSHGCFVCSGASTGYHSGACCHGSACNASYDQRRRELSSAEAAKIQLWLDMENVWKTEVRDWLTAEREHRYQLARAGQRERVERAKAASWLAEEKRFEKEQEFARNVIQQWLDAEQRWLDAEQDRLELERQVMAPTVEEPLQQWERELLADAGMPVVTPDATVEVEVTVTVDPEPKPDYKAIRAKMAKARRVNKVHVEAKVDAPKTKAAEEMHRKLGVK